MAAFIAIENRVDLRNEAVSPVHIRVDKIIAIFDRGEDGVTLAVEGMSHYVYSTERFNHFTHRLERADR